MQQQKPFLRNSLLEGSGLHTPTEQSFIPEASQHPKSQFQLIIF